MLTWEKREVAAFREQIWRCCLLGQILADSGPLRSLRVFSLVDITLETSPELARSRWKQSVAQVWERP